MWGKIFSTVIQFQRQIANKQALTNRQITSLHAQKEWDSHPFPKTKQTAIYKDNLFFALD